MQISYSDLKFRGRSENGLEAKTSKGHNSATGGRIRLRFCMNKFSIKFFWQPSLIKIGDSHWNSWLRSISFDPNGILPNPILHLLVDTMWTVLFYRNNKSDAESVSLCIDGYGYFCRPLHRSQPNIIPESGLCIFQKMYNFSLNH